MEIMNANRRIDFPHQYEDEFEQSSAPEEQAGWHVYRVLAIAGELGGFYKLNQREAFSHGWDYAPTLKSIMIKNQDLYL